MQDSQRQEFIRELLEDTDREFSDEELLHMLIRKKISADTSAAGEKTTFGQRAADNVAKFAGSWGFIFSFLGVMFVWMVLNILMAAKAFDPYPFILLNLLLSCIAAVQAPLIMFFSPRNRVRQSPPKKAAAQNCAAVLFWRSGRAAARRLRAGDGTRRGLRGRPSIPHLTKNLALQFRTLYCAVLP